MTQINQNNEKLINFLNCEKCLNRESFKEFKTEFLKLLEENDNKISLKWFRSLYIKDNKLKTFYNRLNRLLALSNCQVITELQPYLYKIRFNHERTFRQQQRFKKLKYIVPKLKQE